MNYPLGLSNRIGATQFITVLLVSLRCQNLERPSKYDFVRKSLPLAFAFKSKLRIK